MDFSKINANEKSLNALLGAFGKTRFAKSDFGDETEWKLQKDKAGNGSAKLRFLPSPTGEYFVETRDHGFKIKDAWYIERCPKTLDWENPCPACEYADALKKGREWDHIPESEQAGIRPIFGKTSYWANVLVEKDPENPENEGKIFKYRFGKKILEKIYNRAIDDPIDGTKGINVFDPVEGASFTLRCKKVKGFFNYDDSSFGMPESLFGGDADKIDELIKSGQNINEERGEKKFSSYEDANKKLKRLIGGKNVVIPDAPPVKESHIDKEEKQYDSSEGVDIPEGNEDDDAFNYFKQLADTGDDVPF